VRELLNEMRMMRMIHINRTNYRLTLLPAFVDCWRIIKENKNIFYK